MREIVWKREPWLNSAHFHLENWTSYTYGSKEWFRIDSCLKKPAGYMDQYLQYLTKENIAVVISPEYCILRL